MRKKPTIGDYIEAGNISKIYRKTFFEMESIYEKILSSSDIRKLHNTIKVFDKFRSEAESMMFNENPDLPDYYVNVFYGALTFKENENGKRE